MEDEECLNLSVVKVCTHSFCAKGQNTASFTIWLKDKIYHIKRSVITD